MHRARTRSGIDYHPDEHLLLRAHPRTAEDALVRGEWGSMLALDPKVGPERDYEVPEGLVVATCTWSEHLAIRSDGEVPGLVFAAHPLVWATATLNPAEPPLPVASRPLPQGWEPRESRLTLYRSEEVPIGTLVLGCGWATEVQVETMEVGA